MNKDEMLKKIANLDPETIDAAYRFRQFQFMLEDIETHILDLVQDETISAAEGHIAYLQREELADKILKSKDVTIPEYDFYDSTILNFIREFNSHPYILISYCEREMSVDFFSSYEEARSQMMDKLRKEIAKDGELIKEMEERNIFKDFYYRESDAYGFGLYDAWSNIDDDCYCDWKIVDIPENK